MVKFTRRLFAILLCVLIVASALVSCFTVTAAGNALFKDEFSSAKLSGWSKTDLGSVTGGKYVVSGTGVNTVAATETKDGIGITADMQITRKADPATGVAYGNGTAAVAFNASADGKTYYEFGLGINQKGVAYVFLCLNRANGTSPVIKKTKNIEGLSGGRVLENTTYTLKVLLYGGKIYGYINDILFCQTEDTLKSGKAGVAAWNATATVDNFTLHALGEKKVESVQVLNAPAEVEFGKPLGIQLQVNYSGLFSSEVLEETNPNVKISGYTGAGNKKITVAYGGKSDAFNVKINPAKAAQEVFNADFSKAEDWTFTSQTNKTFGFTYSLQLGNGKMYSTMPKIGQYNSSLIATALVNKKFDTLTDYAVDVKAKITADSATASARVGSMDIYFGNNGATLAFRLQSNGEVRVYNGSTLISNKTTSAIALGKELSIRVTVTSGVATLEIGGKTISAYIDQNMRPYFGVRSVNGVMEMSSYKITDLGARSPLIAKSAVLTDMTGEKVTEYTGNGINLDKFLFKVTYYTGETRYVALTKDMLSAYETVSEEPQTVTVTYGSAKVSFTYKHTPYIFLKTFNTNDLTDLSITHPEWFTPSVQKGKLYIDVDSLPIKDNKTTMITAQQGIKLQDAVVSTDFRFTKTHVNTSMLALQTRKIGSTHGYDLRFTYMGYNNTFSLALIRLHSYGNTSVMSWTHAGILEKLGVEYLDISQPLNLKMENAGRSVYIWLNGTLMGTFYDDTEMALVDAGNCFLKVQNCSIELDNIAIGEMEERQIKNISVEGGNDGVIELYKGFELEPMQYDLRINYTDGMTTTTPMLATYLTMPDALQVGMNEIPVSYMGFNTTLKVNVLERPTYLKEFTDKLAALDAAKITAADQEKVAELKQYFDSFSPGEVKELEESTYKKYWDIIEALDRAKVPEIEGKDLLYVNDFSTTGLNEEEWNVKYEAPIGKWFVRNGYIINEQLAYGVSGTSWCYLNPVYGDIEMVETDFCLVNDGAFASVVMNITDNGYYHARITNKYADSEGRPAFMVQLYKFEEGMQKKLAEVYTLVYNIDLKVGEMCAFRMMEQEGMLRVYVNDTLIIQYNDADSGRAYYEGAVAYRSCENDTKYDNLRIYGVTTEPPTKGEKVIEPTTYTDTFEDETVDKDPSHWIEAYDYTNRKITNHWKVMNKGGSKVYGSVANKVSYTWLHAFEIDPEFKTKFMYSGSGKVGFLARVYDETSWLALGYDTASKKWFLAATESTVQEDTQMVWADTATPLTAGEWYNAEIYLKGETVKLVINGATVLEVDKVECNSFGRVGFFAKNASMYVDDVDLKFVNGGAFDDGVIEYDIVDGYTRTGTNMEIENLGNGKLLGVVGGSRYLSEDHGTTWRNITTEAQYADVKGVGLGYPSLLNLGDGKFMMLYAYYGDYQVYLSKDNMETWERVGSLLEPEDHIDEYGNTNTAIIHVNSLTKATLKDGTVRVFMPIAFRRFNMAGNVQLGHYTRIFYSDDMGYTWKESETSSKDVLIGFREGGSSTTAEGKILQCADGTLRYYQSRNDYGNIIYFESYDDGVTWTNCGTLPFMQCAKSSFSLGEDPYNPGTYYLLWVSSAPEKLGSIHLRTKISLARTTDGKNWEFLSDIEKTSNYSNDYSAHVRQFLDPSMTVTEDYVYCTYGRSNAGEYNSAHNNQTPRYVRYEKAKLVAKPWNDATITDTNFNDHLEWGVMPKTKFGLGDIFTTVGGTIKEVSLNGVVNEVNIRMLTRVSDEPNMYKLGKYTVTFMNANLHTISYEVEVVPNYDLFWTVKGKGTITPDPDGVLRMMEGAEETFTLKPARGYKVGSVTINGQKVKVTNKTFTISNVQENQEITVVFAKLTIMDYLLWIILGVVVIAGIAVAAILLIKKQKRKAPTPDLEDISSNSTPPADEN